MEKNWLIRTKNNHILGPVSKNKIRELISNNSIKGDDEVCSGNGYWIYVREQELIAKYILENNSQSFNPVQEAEVVGAISPIESDLEYPDINAILSTDMLDLAVSASEENSEKKKVEPSEEHEEFKFEIPSSEPLTNKPIENIDDKEIIEDFSDTESEDIEQDLLPSEDDLEYPDDIAVVTPIAKPVETPRKAPVKKAPVKTSAANQAPAPPKLKRRIKKAIPRKKTLKKPRKSNLILMYLIVVLLFLVSIFAVFKRDEIINQINKRVSFSLINPVYAQELDSKKKKWYNLELPTSKNFSVNHEQTPLGFYLQTTLSSDFSCSSILSLVDLYFALHLDQNEEFQTFIRCYNEQNQKYKEKFKIKGQFLNISKSQKEKLENLQISTKESEEKILKEVDNFLGISYNKEKAFNLSKKISPYKNIYFKLVNIYLYKLLGNHTRAEKILIEILDSEMIEHMFLSELQFISLNKQLVLMREILEKLESQYEDDKYFDILIYYLYSQSNLKFQEMINQNFNVKKSMSYIRNIYHSNKYGRNLLFVWAPAIYEEGSVVEYMNLVNNKSIFDSKKIKEKELIFYRKTELINKDLKPEILELFKELKKKNTFTQKNLYFRLLEDADFKKFIHANLVLKLGLINNQKRSFYKTELANNNNISYCSFRLIMMGDYNLNYIFKAMKFENNRL